jgi:hypothetical protein
MKVAWFLTVAVLVLGIGAAAGQDAAPQNGPQNGIVQQWAGRIARMQALEAPIKGFVANAAEFSQLWQTLRLTGDAPAIDFGKYFVLVATSRSSLFKVRAVQLDANGDLKTVVVATPDLRPDYAVVLTQVERAGVRTVHGQPVGQ